MSKVQGNKGAGNKSDLIGGIIGKRYRDMLDETRGLVPVRILDKLYAQVSVYYADKAGGMHFIGMTKAPLSMFSNVYPKTAEEFSRLGRQQQHACRVGYVLNAALRAAEEVDEEDLPEFDSGMEDLSE